MKVLIFGSFLKIAFKMLHLSLFIPVCIAMHMYAFWSKKHMVFGQGCQEI